MIFEPVLSRAHGEPFARWKCRLSILAFAWSLGACTVPGTQPIVPNPLSVRAEMAAASSAPASAAPEQTRITALPAPPSTVPSATAAARDSAAVASAAGASTEPASINLDQVTLGTFAQLVYADLLKKNVNVDAQVMARKDLVTFRSGPAQSPEKLESAARLLLKSYGVTVLDVGGLVRVVPDNASSGALPEIRRGAAMPDTPLPLRPVFQLVELQAVRQVDVIGWLRMMFGDRVKVQEDASRNAVLLSGTPDNMQAAIEAIRVLDQPVLRGVQSVSVSPQYWSADDLARKLIEVLSAEGYAVQPIGQQAGGVRYPIVVLPVAGLNAVFVFASAGAVLDHVTAWARKLDQPNERGIGRNFFTYAVKHKDAAVLAKTLEQLIGRAVVTAVATGAAAAATQPRAGSVVVDASTNTLIFLTSQDEYSQITSLLQSLDRPARGALIEVTVAELLIDDNSQLGIEWLANQALANGGTATAGTLGGLAIGTAGFNFKVFDSIGGLRFVLNALASDNKATVLSSPRVLARNGETATIQVGQEVPIITSQQTTGSSTGVVGNPNILQTIQYRNTGVILRVKPVIHSSDQIDLDVTQEVSAAKSTTTGVSVSPTFTTRKIDTKLTMKNGATLLLGGLISDESSRGSAGIPFLKDIPILGALFSTQTGTGQRRELVMLITPYIINDDHDAEAVTGAFRKMLGPWAATVPAPSGVTQPVIPLVPPPVADR